MFPFLSRLELALINSRDVVDKMGFVAMTPVQAGTIPRAMKHQDCVVEVGSYTACVIMDTDDRPSLDQAKRWHSSCQSWNDYADATHLIAKDRLQQSSLRLLEN